MMMHLVHAVIDASSLAPKLRNADLKERMLRELATTFKQACTIDGYPWSFDRDMCTDT